MKIKNNSTTVTNSQTSGFPLTRRNFLKAVGGGIILFFSESTWLAKSGTAAENPLPASDHFNGTYFFNPGSPSIPFDAPKRGILGWVGKWFFGSGWPKWPDFKEFPLGLPPPVRVPKGTIRTTCIGHATFLVQMDGLNILIDPVWADRASPFSWTGPKRVSRPGLRLEDLPSIDVVLVSHNHYDHLDISTLKHLAQKGTPRLLVPLGNRVLVLDSGFSQVNELDWWESTPLTADVKVTLVRAQHYSSRTLWDHNKALWGGFVISGPSGHVYFAGDTGYSSFFSEIGRLFSPIRVAILPISPFQPKSADAPSTARLRTHMRPRQAIIAHFDLKAQVSIAHHFQVFQLGPDGFDDAVQELAAYLKIYDLKPEDFLALNPGQSHEITTE